MTRYRLALPFVLAASLLSACVQMPLRQAQPAVPYNPPLGAAAADAALPVAGGGSGLEERQPDLCGAKQYVPYLGQPGTVIPTLGLTKEYRVVEFRGIEPQNYVPNRIVFRLNEAGTIQNIDCG